LESIVFVSIRKQNREIPNYSPWWTSFQKTTDQTHLQNPGYRSNSGYQNQHVHSLTSN